MRTQFLMMLVLGALSALIASCTLITDPNGYRVEPPSSDTIGEDAGTGSTSDNATDTMVNSSPTSPTDSSTHTETVEATSSANEETNTDSLTENPSNHGRTTDTDSLAETDIDTTDGTRAGTDTAPSVDTETDTTATEPSSTDTGTGQCIPSCEGRECGDDGCGGFCGPCTTDQHCDENLKCVAGRTGGRCEYPIVADFFPFFDRQSPLDFADDYQPLDTDCSGVTSDGMIGYDLVYQFTPAVTAVHHIETGYLGGLGYDAAFFVTTACEIESSTCIVSKDEVGGTESLDVLLQQGVTYYIFVDSLNHAEQATQSFTFRITIQCQPGCDALEYCNEYGQCVPYSAGYACRKPADILLDTPMSANTLEPLFEGYYEIYGGDNCSENYIVPERGRFAPDNVYRFIPPETGDYDITLLSVTWNAILYVEPDDTEQAECADRIFGCVPFLIVDRTLDEFGNPLPQRDTVTVHLLSTEQYNIFVDGNSKGIDFHGYGGPYTIEINRHATK